jgi:hypothetical protein
MILHKNLDVNSQGHLTIGGVDTVDLAKLKLYLAGIK